MSKIDSKKPSLVCHQDVNSSKFLSRNNTLIFTVFHVCVFMNACYNSTRTKLSLSELVQYICRAKAAKGTQLAKVSFFLFFSCIDGSGTVY